MVKILSEQNKGETVNEICREHGISQPRYRATALRAR
ncbi:hypothetical protein H1R16_12100 [Marnyiella aurantia]|uniref:Transposase n=1 Tax=Marnyiella aurantia TaxID=2758037 RepID=A0A7D7LRD3_9FLAO|nr:hypothetical protein [Marnyiella aurantia]QMS99640.1 hypothetical protein H1R16_12100 [Marnyiella aurantia]